MSHTTSFLNLLRSKNQQQWLFCGGALLLLYVWYRIISAPADFHLIMATNLIFHEAGHVVFMPFGGLVYVLGGTIFELGIPLLCLGVFFRQKSKAGVMFAMWWVATALFSVGTYVSDARAQALPLLSGDPKTHDWTHILETTGLLAYDTAIGSVVLCTSYVALILSIIIGYHGWQTK